ncbi:hypothetical protein AOLI_G00166090 [Acnodon oligacanthus]
MNLEVPKPEPKTGNKPRKGPPRFKQSVSTAGSRTGSGSVMGFGSVYRPYDVSALEEEHWVMLNPPQFSAALE